MSDTKLQEATQRIERLLVEALGARHEAIEDWARIRFALKDAERYQRLLAAGLLPQEPGEAQAAPAEVAPQPGAPEDDGGELQVSYGLKWCDQCGEGTVQGMCRKRLPDCKFVLGASAPDVEPYAKLVESFTANGKLLLAAGEMTAQELRTVKAVLTMIAAQIRRGDAGSVRGELHKELLEAANAVVQRWDSPKWKELPHTGEYIARLRAAAAAFEAGQKPARRPNHSDQKGSAAW